MNDEKEKDKERDACGKNQGEAADIIKELGLLASGSNFKSDVGSLTVK